MLCLMRRVLILLIESQADTLSPREYPSSPMKSRTPIQAPREVHRGSLTVGVCLDLLLLEETLTGLNTMKTTLREQTGVTRGRVMPRGTGLISPTRTIEGTSDRAMHRLLTTRTTHREQTGVIVARVVHRILTDLIRATKTTPRGQTGVTSSGAMHREPTNLARIIQKTTILTKDTIGQKRGSFPQQVMPYPLKKLVIFHCLGSPWQIHATQTGLMKPLNWWNSRLASRSCSQTTGLAGRWVQGSAGPCLTTVTWRCRKNFSQWERSFQRKLGCHWLKGLWQHQIAVVRQGLSAMSRNDVSGLLQDRGISIANTLLILLFCTKPLL